MKPPTGGRAKALDIWHPELERLKIKSVGVVDVGQAYQSDNGEWTIEVKFIQFRPQPRISLAKVEASKGEAKQLDFAEQWILDNDVAIATEESGRSTGSLFSRMLQGAAE